MKSEFEGRVAIVTGAANGLGRSHARALAAEGAQVVVNDLGVRVDGGMAPSDASLRVVEEITAAGGHAVADYADVSDAAQVDALVARTMERFGRVDILVNNAGLLRDKTFAKMDLADFRLILDIHVMGSVNFVKAVWPIMRDQNYGRIVLTSSSSGLFGNFGQSNYGTAKAGMLGLMNVLHIEGARNGIRVNCLAPTAATDMTKGLLSAESVDLLDPDSVSPAVLFLVSENAPSRTIIGAGAGVFSTIQVLETPGVYLPPGKRSPADFAARFAEMQDLAGAATLDGAFDQTEKFVRAALAAIRKGE
ncbi:MAG: SDR family NAD(P)-dependent oxidoreductase [Rhizobium sp.]|nr:SDR family NAD(P)-dependent oxidoreductase [Rhizobium sp.]MBX9455310.1 SDR family NAD(P)-dependent oxidoreductase [Rhizobium sp.]